MKLKCKLCGDVIKSMHRHDMKWCKCGKCAIDGGNDYTRICGEPKDYELVEEK
jgi:hypothetical protein